MVSNDPQPNQELTGQEPTLEDAANDNLSAEFPDDFGAEPDIGDSVPVTEPPDEYYEIRVVTLDIPVRIEYSAIRSLRAAPGSNKPRLGLLRGTRSLDAITIEKFELPPAESVPEGLIDSKLIKSDQSVLGFFRTHSNGWPEIQEADRKNANECFSNRGGLFALIHNPAHRPWSAELFNLAENGQYLSKEGAHEFYLDEYLLKNGYSATLPEYNEPEELEEPRGNFASGIGLVAAALIIIGLVGYGVTRWDAVRDRAENLEYSRMQTISTLKLSVRRNGGGDYVVEWDRDAAVIEQASSASLVIEDGKTTRAFALERDQLKVGHALYTPLPLSSLSGNVRIRLEVDQGTRSQSETVLMLAAPAALPESAEVTVYAGKVRTANGAEARVISDVAPSVTSQPFDKGATPTEPAVIVREFPTLTPAAKRALDAKPQGSKVFLSVLVTVDANGNVTNTNIVPSREGGIPVPDSLRSMAVDAAKLWKFRPALMNGKAVEGASTITFTFE
jgi:hypothetical protein